MQNRVVRLSIVLLLFGVAAGGAFLARPDVTGSPPAGATSALDQQADHLFALVAELTATQAGYVASAGESARALDRVPVLLREATRLSARIASLLHSDDAAASLRSFVDATSALAHADMDAREHLLLGDTQRAAHVIAGDAREAARAMTAALTGLRTAERRVQHASTASVAGPAGTIVAAVAALWACGLILLALVPAGRGVAAAAGADRSMASDPRPATVPALPAVADLCGEMAKVETAADLTALLERAVTVLDANGIVVWMSAGDALHPVAAAGSPAIPLSRLIPIDRHDAHHAASAWTRGSIEATTRNQGEPGVLAIPLFAGAQAKGVLAVELRAPEMESPAVRALATLIAAQLSTVVTGAPALNPA